MTEAILRVAGLNKRFGALTATDNLSLELRAGEIHALIGPNGAGKSTLVQQITGHLKSDSGTVELMGEDITNLAPQLRARKGLGRTFQVSSLAMEHTVLQNAVLGALGRRGSIFKFFAPVMQDKDLVAQAQTALDQVGLSDFAASRVSDLSHGQRRQLEMAVALTLNPSVFLMDEPMAGLGLDGSKQMIVLLDRIRAQAPILLIEHDMDAVFSLADRISVLVYGKIIATGTPDEIRADAMTRQAYLGEEVTA